MRVNDYVTNLWNTYYTIFFIVILEYTYKKIILKQPQTGPSGGITEDGIVIIEGVTEDGTVTIEGDSSMCVIAPEDLPVRQDVEGEVSDTDDPDPV